MNDLKLKSVRCTSDYLWQFVEELKLQCFSLQLPKRKCCCCSCLQLIALFTVTFIEKMCFLSVNKQDNVSLKDTMC